MGAPPAADEKGTPQSLLCGERKSQDTVGIFRLRKMEHCSLRFDEASGSGRQETSLFLQAKVLPGTATGNRWSTGSLI